RVQIAQAARRRVRRPAGVVFAVENGSPIATLRFPATPTGSEISTGPEAGPPSPEHLERARLNSNLTFDTFVTGKANQLARAAAMQVAENPGGSHTPLFLYGGVGLGKTHLIHAVGNNILARRPDAKVRYIHAEQ